MTSPHTAMILAAGRGRRMRHLNQKPKPLTEVGGKTLLDHTLDKLHAYGIENVVINLHHKKDMITQALSTRHHPPITYSIEDELLETGGGVKNALPLLGDDPVFLINADALWFDGALPTLERMRQAWNPQTMDAMLLVMDKTKAEGFSDKGDFFMDQAGHLTRPAADKKDKAPFVFIGLQIVKPSLYQEVTDTAFSNNVIFDQTIANKRLTGLAHDGKMFHVGTPEALETARCMANF